MINAIAQQWQRLNADYAAAHQAYMDLKSTREDDASGGAGLGAHHVAKANLAQAQRAMHDFCQGHAEIC